MASDPARVTFPRGAWLALSIFGVLMLGSLLTQLALIEDQRRTVRTQRAIAERQAREALPLLRALRPLAGDARTAVPGVKRLGGRVERLTRQATPLVADLRSADAGEVVRGLGTLTGAMLDADLPATTLAVRDMTAELARQDRLQRLLVRGVDVLGQVRATDLIRRSARAADVVPRTLRRSLSVQHETLELQRQALAAIRETLEVARETERHAESLDRKTGGTG